MSRELQSLALADRNQVFLDAQENIDPAIQIRSLGGRISPWRSMIGRTAFKLEQGLDKKSFRFHSGITPQRGLNFWHAIQISSKATAGDPGYDATKYNPYTVSYGFDSVSYGGFGIEYNTPSISIRDLRFLWQWKQQLSMLARSLMQSS